MAYKKVCGIYKITSPTGKIYIGQSRNLSSRRNSYRNGRGYKYQPRVKHSVEKYGWDEHTFEIIEKCEFEEMNIRERYWQDYYEVLGKNGLNCVLTETDVLPRVISEERREKLSKQMSGKNNPMYGKDWREGRSKEDVDSWRKNMSETFKNKEGQAEFMRGLRKVKGKDHPMYGRTGEAHPSYGRKLSEDQKQKIRDVMLSDKHPHRGKKRGIYCRKIAQSNSKKCINIKTKEPSIIRDICKEHNLNYKALYAKLKGDNPNNTDYMFLEDYESGVDLYAKYQIRRIQRRQGDFSYYLSVKDGIYYEEVKQISDIYGIEYSKLKGILEENLTLQWIL